MTIANGSVAHGPTVCAGATRERRRSPRPRADALRNRERIVTAAREMFVEFGADVPLDEIARRAGVGNATLYRHFPDRTVLIREVVVSVLSRVTERAEQAERDAVEGALDPFAVVRRFAHEVADERIGALCPLLSGTLDREHPELLAARGGLEEAVQGLLRRAQAAGRLRADVAVGDLLLPLSQITRPLPGTACPDVDRFVHRHLQLLLDGMEAPARSELPGSPATLETLRRHSRA